MGCTRLSLNLITICFADKTPPFVRDEERKTVLVCGRVYANMHLCVCSQSYFLFVCLFDVFMRMCAV